VLEDWRLRTTTISLSPASGVSDLQGRFANFNVGGPTDTQRTPFSEKHSKTRAGIFSRLILISHSRPWTPPWVSAATLEGAVDFYNTRFTLCLSDVRSHRTVELSRMFFASSINPFEGGRLVCGGRGVTGIQSWEEAALGLAKAERQDAPGDGLLGPLGKWWVRLLRSPDGPLPWQGNIIW
jgi:hypothetical protein